MALALWAFDGGEVGDVLRGADWVWLPLALPFFTAAKYVDSWRWWYLLGNVARRPPQLALFGAFLIGNFVNNVMPFRAGDVAKIQVLSYRYGVSRAALAASVFVVEATLDGVVFIVAMVMAFLAWDLGRVEGVTIGLVAGLGGMALVAFGLALLVARTRRLPVPARVRRRFAEGEASLRSGMGVLHSVRSTAIAVGLSIPAWAMEAAMFMAVGEWVFSLGAGYPVYFTAMVAANLAVAVPFGLWNVGPYEALVGGVLSLSGVDPSVAVSYATALHLATNAWIDLIGLIAIWVMGITPRQVFAVHRVTPAGGST